MTEDAVSPTARGRVISWSGWIHNDGDLPRRRLDCERNWRDEARLHLRPDDDSQGRHLAGRNGVARWYKLHTTAGTLIGRCLRERILDPPDQRITRRRPPVPVMYGQKGA